MEESTSKEKILKRVRNALINKPDILYQNEDFDSGIYKTPDESDDILFAREFTKVGGQFVYCESEQELAKNLSLLIHEQKWDSVFTKEPEIISMLKKAELPFEDNDEKMKHAGAAITKCEFLIARLGSIMISSAHASGRRLNVFPESHIVIAHPSQFVRDVKDAFARLNEKYPGNQNPSLVSMITGPSRTADIEKTLVMGAHGPKSLYVFLVENE